MSQPDSPQVLCHHLQPVLESLQKQGVKATFAAQAWSRNCRMWAYVDRVIDCEGLIEAFRLAPCVVIHDHRGTHDGSERGLVCQEHHDAVMGLHPGDAVSVNT